MEHFGLVLSGGGAKGAYQIGVWKAMKELRFCEEITGISGASIGALNGALFASGDLKKAEEAWGEVTPLTVLDPDLKKIDGVEGFAGREGMLDLMEKYVDFGKLQNYPYSIYCSVARLMQEQYFCEYKKLNHESKERIEQVLTASSALPVVYEAVMMDGYLYRDGGLCDNVPIRPLYEEGYRRFLVIGMDKKQAEAQNDFKDAEFITVVPEYSLGDLEATIDFTQDFIRYCMKLGYRDGIRILSAYCNHDRTEEQQKMQAEIDHHQVLAELKMEKIEKEANRSMDNINKLLGKYGIDGV